MNAADPFLPSHNFDLYDPCDCLHRDLVGRLHPDPWCDNCGGRGYREDEA
jgi:hypothetical protein